MDHRMRMRPHAEVSVLVPPDEAEVIHENDARCQSSAYFRVMARLWTLTRSHALDALVALAAIEGAAEIALRRHALQAPRSTLWFTAPATAIVVLPLLLRRRHPFAAPAA